MTEWLFEQARELSDEQAGGHGNRWGVFNDDVESFVTQWLPRALEHAKLVELGATGSQGQDRLLTEGELRCEGLLYADRDEDQGRAGLLALVALDVESESGERTNILWSAYPFFAEGIRYPVRLDEIALHPNRLEAHLILKVAGTLVFAFDPLFYKHRGLYRADVTMIFSLCALAYTMIPTPEQEVVIDDPEKIRAFRASRAWVESHGSYTEADEAAALEAWKPESPEDFEPISIDCSQGSFLLPNTDGPADDANYQGEVKAVVPNVYRLFGIPVWRVDVVVAKPDEQDLLLPIFVTELSFEDAWRPSPGEYVSGSAWIQGWMVESTH